ncbi:MAG TPA: hypothetical protein VNX21_04360 [Candidatus Thermoplasmatota archaeon]|nr:hypothetical protein [Candidatus Thermoplasmatota archaeon]
MTRAPRGPEQPERDVARNERLAEGNLKRGAPVADGQTGGNALSGGQTEPPVPGDPDEEASPRE